jgi:integrase
VEDYGQGRRFLVCQCNQFAANKVEIDIRWQGRRYTITHDDNGQRLPDLLAAETALGLINNQIKRGCFDPALWTPKSPLLWEHYLAAYLVREEARCRAGQISAATLQKKQALAKHLAWFNGTNIRDLLPGKIQDFASSKTGLAPKTLADLLGELGHILKEAEVRRDLDRAPAVPKIKVPERAPRWITAEQQAAAVRHIPQEHWPIFMFLMEYGCRVAEACALCWDQVHPDQGVVVLARTFSRRRLVEGTKQRRDNPLPIVGWFQGWLAEQPRGIGQAPVFRNPKADPHRNPARHYTPDVLRRLWAEARAAAGLGDISLKNATRHSAGSQRRREGWDEGLIARLLGHTRKSYALRYYVAQDADILRGPLESGVSVESILNRKPASMRKDKGK